MKKIVTKKKPLTGPLGLPEGTACLARPPVDAREPSAGDDVLQGRSGEGAHSAMKHWLAQERKRLSRREP